MAKNIEKDRVVKNTEAQSIQKDRVVKNKNMVQPSSSKWAGIPMDEEGKKRFRQTWKEIDSCLKTLKKNIDN